MFVLFYFGPGGFTPGVTATFTLFCWKMTSEKG